MLKLIVNMQHQIVFYSQNLFARCWISYLLRVSNYNIFYQSKETNSFFSTRETSHRKLIEPAVFVRKVAK